MRIDALGVQAFVALAEHESFRRAAASLFISQAAISRRLKNLEAYLGVELVERSTRRFALTRVGAGFLPQAKRLLAELHSSLQQIRETGQLRGGDVTLACVPTVGVQYLPRIIETYARTYPENRVCVLDHSSAGVERSVAAREAEFGIAIAGPHSPELTSELLLKDRFVIVCTRDHAFARGARVTWAQLAQARLILPGQGSSNRPLLDARLPESVKLRSQYEVQRSSTAVGMVAAGLGVAVVPSLAMQPGTYPSLRVIPLVQPVVERSFALVRRRGGVLSPAAEALVRIVFKETRPVVTRARAA
ncbi:MAG TPA: LysR substrate-binding domain-containing protein [Burkholderiaceae bacterium]|nr:LysR substrate-binding domain-containing protein [Burkholderiaceae bacterium]